MLPPALRLAALVLFSCWAARAQEARLRPTEEVCLPPPIDGNSPSFWLEDRLRMFTSIGQPQMINEADSQFGPWAAQTVDRTTLSESPIWIEAVWVDADGTIFGWYHHEPLGLYEDSLLTVPKIGAIVSFDGGLTVHDLGIVLESGDPADGSAENGAFAGGHGDFSVILDRERQHFYFFFSNYGGPAETQGVAVARMAFGDRFEPVGKVAKYHQGGWDAPGIGGQVTPIFPVRQDWRLPAPDAFWGPSVHWNDHLGCHVMLLNRACGSGWTQEGIYISYLADPALADEWSEPRKILDRSDLAADHSFYPQVIGLETGGTDRLAGRTARLYVSGSSTWEIDFFTTEEIEAKPAPVKNPPPGSRLPPTR